MVTDGDVEKMRARLAALPPITDEQHARNIEWLGQYDDDDTDSRLT